MNQAVGGGTSFLQHFSGFPTRMFGKLFGIFWNCSGFGIVREVVSLWK